jgi:hypothetical protein
MLATLSRATILASGTHDVTSRVASSGPGLAVTGALLRYREITEPRSRSVAAPDLSKAIANAAPSPR